MNVCPRGIAGDSSLFQAAAARIQLEFKDLTLGSVLDPEACDLPLLEGPAQSPDAIEGHRSHGAAVGLCLVCDQAASDRPYKGCDLDCGGFIRSGGRQNMVLDQP